MVEVALLPKDRILVAVNRTTAEWDKRTRELKKKKMLRKQQAWDQGEETGSDDDNDDDEFDEELPTWIGMS